MSANDETNAMKRSMNMLKEQISMMRMIYTAAFKDLMSKFQTFRQMVTKKQNINVNKKQADQEVDEFKKKLGPLRRYVIELIVKNSAVIVISGIYALIQGLIGTAFVIAIGVTNTAVAGLKGILSIVGQLAQGVTIGAKFSVGSLKAAVAPVLKWLSDGFNSAMSLERQQMAIDHAVGAGKQGASGEQAKADSRAYIEQLKNAAYGGPFDTSEVMAAGMKAVQGTGGNTKQAMEILKLAQNIAAVNPGKSLDEAIGAVLSLKSGGSKDALKEFGFSAANDKGGDLSQIKNDKGVSVKDMFKGGTEKYAATGEGLVKTIKGKLQSGLEDAGMKMLQALKPALQQLVPLLDKLQPMFAAIGTALAQGIGTAVSFMNDNRGAIEGFTDTFAQLFTKVATGAGQFLTTLKPSLQATAQFIQNIVVMVAQFIEPLLAPLMTLFQSIIGWLVENMPVFQAAIGEVFKALAPIIQAVVNVFMYLWSIWEQYWPLIQEIISTVWTAISPLFQALADIIEIVFFGLQKLYEWLMPVMEAIWDFLKPIIDGVGQVFSWFGEGVSWLKDKIMGSGDGGNGADPKPHAAGLHTVPRDNYPALLHKNEAVLTAQEANNYRNGVRGRGITINLNNPVAREEADFTKWARILKSELESASFNMA